MENFTCTNCGSSELAKETIPTGWFARLIYVIRVYRDTLRDACANCGGVVHRKKSFRIRGRNIAVVRGDNKVVIQQHNGVGDNISGDKIVINR